MRVGIALGSNLGDRLAHLRAAAAAIGTFAEPPVLLSPIYESAPVDCPPDSPAFLNAAMEIGYSGSLDELLDSLQGVERARNRPTVRLRNSPRTVDLDIVYADDLVHKTADLEIPHPRALARPFVVFPFADIAPDREIPRSDETFRQRKRSLVQEGNFEISRMEDPLV